MTIQLDEIYQLSYLARDLEPNQYSPNSIDKTKYIVNVNNLLPFDDIVSKFVSNNFVILKLDSNEYFKNNILTELSKFFGKMIEQTPAKDSIVYNIESSRSNKTSTKIIPINHFTVMVISNQIHQNYCTSMFTT
ncbi:MAG: hypothetical protein HC932_01570 [Thermales bacterium]|nr:hypothetical protein [Thermales bacterium]